MSGRDLERLEDEEPKTRRRLTGTEYSFSAGHSADTIAVLFSANNEEFMVCVVLEAE
jgi:hypothetical protein